MHISGKQFLSLLFILLIIVSKTNANSLLLPDTGCEDGYCPIPAINENNQPVYAIVSPVGYQAVEMIKHANVKHFFT